MRIRFALLIAAVTAAGLLAPVASATPPERPCERKPSAGEWPTFGGDLGGTRHQPEADGIGRTSTPTLQPVWSYTTGAAFAGTADLNGTPIVSGGCVFLNTAEGDVIALDAATGAEIWRVAVRRNDPSTTTDDPGLGGYFVSSPAVAHGKVFALVSVLGAPYAIALDINTGRTRWTSAPLMSQLPPEWSRAGYYTNATAVVHDGVLMAGFSPAEGDMFGQGGLTLIDVETGAILDTVFAVPEEDWTAPPVPGYAGGGIWTAPAVDTEHGYAYVGTGNPFSKKIEHPHTNAILKIDIDRERATFGDVVAHRKGLVEQYRQEVRDAVDPVCEEYGEDPNLQLIVGDSAPCLQLDQDFGAPPTLYTDTAGRTVIVDLQKAGVLHAAYTDDLEPAGELGSAVMAEAWQQIVGVTCPACNAAAWAFHDGSLVGASSPVGTMLSVNGDDGAHQWASPIVDGTHYQSTSVTDEVAFTVDNAGNLLAFDLATGVPLLRRPIQVDVDAAGGAVAPGLSSSGVAIASGMVVAAVGNTVTAYAPM